MLTEIYFSGGEVNIIGLSMPNNFLEKTILYIFPLLAIIQITFMPAMSKKVVRESSDYEGDESIEEEESFSNLSAYARREKLRKHRLKKQRIYKKKTHGSWSIKQEIKFVEFMKIKREIFQSKEARRRQRIFCQMTKCLKSRSSEQCRSHYQKYEIKFHTFEGIVGHIEEKILQESQGRVKLEVAEKSQVMVKKEENEEPTRDKKKLQLEIFKSKEGSGEWTLVRKNLNKPEYELTINFSNLKQW